MICEVLALEIPLQFFKTLAVQNKCKVILEIHAIKKTANFQIMSLEIKSTMYR